jgi:hypothetical protein
MGWFGPSKDEVWRQLSQQTGAEFVPGDSWKWKSSQVQAHVGPWTITLDKKTVAAGRQVATFTRIRAPYVNPDGFRFTIYRKGILSYVAKLLGTKYIKIGDTNFDDAFVIKSNNEFKVRDLFASPALRALIQAQEWIHLEVKDDDGESPTRFPEGVDELYFEQGGVIMDIARLEGLFDLFTEILHQLCRIGSAYEENPGVTL